MPTHSSSTRSAAISGLGAGSPCIDSGHGGWASADRPGRQPPLRRQREPHRADGAGAFLPQGGTSAGTVYGGAIPSSGGHGGLRAPDRLGRFADPATGAPGGAPDRGRSRQCRQHSRSLGRHVLGHGLRRPAGRAGRAYQGAEEVWVAAGTYRPAKIGDRRALFLAQAGTCAVRRLSRGRDGRDQRDWAANKTVLSGDLGSPLGNAAATPTTW